MEVVISTEEEEDDDEALLRSLIRPEEDRRRLHPELPWRGGYRWFRSANVIPGSELSLGGGLKAMLPDIRHPNRSTAAASVSCGPGSRQVESGSAGAGAAGVPARKRTISPISPRLRSRPCWFMMP